VRAGTRTSTAPVPRTSTRAMLGGACLAPAGRHGHPPMAIARIPAPSVTARASRRSKAAAGARQLPTAAERRRLQLRQRNSSSLPCRSGYIRNGRNEERHQRRFSWRGIIRARPSSRCPGIQLQNRKISDSIFADAKSARLKPAKTTDWPPVSRETNHVRQ
jgi:hypothetical protein